MLKKKLYYDYESQEKNIGGQIFKFFINDNEKNLKEFIYIYKIYPKLKNDITFLDGHYQIGNEPLLITEKDFSSNQENIILTSQSLQNLLYINQNFIDILEKVQSYINLNSFIHYDNYIFHLKTYSKYINNITNKLLNIYSNDEIEIISPLIKEIKKLENTDLTNITYQFINLFSINDNDITKEYNIYTLKQVKNIKLIKEESTINYNWNEKENEYKLSTQNDFTSVLNAFDTNSVSSVQSSVIGIALLNKKKNNSNMHQNGNNMIIIFINLLVIIFAIIALIYENSLNNELLNKISFYKAVCSFNRLILNTMFGYYCFLCYVKYDGEECVHEMKNYLNNIGFSEIYTFNEYEHHLKINSLSDRYKILRSKVGNTRDIEIRNYLTTKKAEIHIIFENNTLKNDKTSYESFDYLMGSFINKLITTSNSENFQTVAIYPLLVDDNFQPLKLINTKNLNKLDSTQIYIYEILISCLDYSNHFYSLQEVIKRKANNQIKINKNILIVFIITLIISNILILGICFYFFKSFKKVVNNKLQTIEILLKNEENIEILNNKIQIISIIFRFYKHNPLKLIKKLSDKMKLTHNKKLEHNNSPNNFEKNYEIEKIKEKIYDLSFIINKFIIILIILIMIYTIYSIIFFVISNESFTKLNNICKIVESSISTCLQFFFELGIIELYQFIKIPENALYNKLWSVYNNKTSENGGNAFVDLLNIIQDTIQKEKSIKELESPLANITNIISMDCSTIFSEMNDKMFSQIFIEHSEMDFEQILVNYCNTIGVLKYKSEDLFVEDLTYSMMKLLVTNYNNNNNIPNYNISELYSVMIISLELYRPLKVLLGDYYFNYLDNQTNSHFYILLCFLLGNIILEIIYFFIIKTRIINQIEFINKNLDRLLIMLKCTN